MDILAKKFWVKFLWKKWAQSKLEIFVSSFLLILLFASFSFKLKVLLQIISLFGFSIEKITNSEKLIILLDKFDSNSNCIEKLELKGTKGYSSKISLMPSNEVIKNVIN